MARGSCGIRGLGHLHYVQMTVMGHAPVVEICPSLLAAGHDPRTPLETSLRLAARRSSGKRRWSRSEHISFAFVRQGLESVASLGVFRLAPESEPMSKLIGRLRELLPFGPVHRSVSGIFLILVANSTSRLIASARDGRSVWPRRQSSTIRKNCSDTRI